MKTSPVRISLTVREIQHALSNAEKGIAQYVWLQSRLADYDPSRDQEFQRRFNAFYRVRRNLAWRKEFYLLLTKVRNDGSTFSEVLREFHSRTGRVEASFCSKLYASLYTTKPVIDSIVLQNLGMKLPAGDPEDRIPKIVELHRKIEILYSDYLSSSQGAALIESFNARYPSVPISKVKMLDFVLWQKRES